ncbi:MAG: GNAT family N-acetyltransferase [Daejeonella sp.]
MEIVKATELDIHVIHELAEKIWWPTYEPILSEEQISFMLKNMYSENALREQILNGMEFLLIERDDDKVAFAGYTIEGVGLLVLKIHKLYVLPSEQGKGTGKMLIEYLSKMAQELNINILELNVNRANPALQFYEKQGFKISETVDIPYYQFVLNDYVMRKVV